MEILHALTFIVEVQTGAIINQRELKYKLKYGDRGPVKTFDYIRSLKRSGYINIHRNPRGYSIEITGKGRIKLLEHNSSDATDGNWRMLSFDIPEKYRKTRDRFRATIKRIGFKQVQKSLWACPFIRADDIQYAIDEYRVNEYVVYLVVSKTDAEKFLEKMFAFELDLE